MREDNYFPKVLLGKVARFTMGQAPEGNTVHEIESSPGIPFLQGNAEFGGMYPEARYVCSSPLQVCTTGDVLISVRAPVGALNKADRSYGLGRGLAAISFIGMCREFGWYATLFESSQLRLSAQGSTFEAVGKANLASLRLPLPGEREQLRIADTLSAVDSSIQAAEQLIAKHQAARRGVLDDLFSERGSWPQDALKFFLAASPKNGFSPSEVDDWTGVRVLGLGCLTDDGFAPRQLKNVSSSYLGVRSALLEDGDLLMTRANTRDLVGFVGRYQDVGGPCLYPDLMMRLRPNQKIIPSFLEYSLRHSYVRRQIMAHAVGTSESMVKISSAIVRNLSVAVPSLEEQQRIVSIIEAHDERIAAERARLEKLRKLKAGLMDDLLTGRVRVDELEDLPV